MPVSFSRVLPLTAGVSFLGGKGKQMTTETITAYLDAKDFGSVRRVLSEMNAVDVARLLRELPEGQEVVAFRLLPKNEAVEVFEQMEPEEQRRLLESFHTDAAKELFNELSPDDRARLLDEAPAMVARKLAQLLDPQERQATLALLGYEENTAGRSMTPDFIDLRRDMTVAQSLERIRKQALRKETIYYSYVIDEQRRLLGVLSLRDLVVAEPEAKVSDIMTEEPKYVVTTDDREQVAHVLSDYDLLAVPVVDHEQRLVGIITWDDAMDIIEAETTEDMYKMAGVGVKEHANSPILESAKRRVPWLAFNMAWAFAAAAIISLFEGTITKVAALAVFMPIVSGQAGNAGIQTSTITIRSIALGEMDWKNMRQVLVKEWGLALIKGTLFGLVLGLIAWGWKGDPVLGLIAGISLFANFFVASTSGVVLPLTLKRIGIDPATIAGVFDTMLSDFMGFLIYLGLATLLVSKLNSGA